MPISTVEAMSSLMRDSMILASILTSGRGRGLEAAGPGTAVVDVEGASPGAEEGGGGGHCGTASCPWGDRKNSFKATSAMAARSEFSRCRF